MIYFLAGCALLVLLLFAGRTFTVADPRKLAGLIFRPGFTTVSEGARGIGMDVVRDLVNKAGGRVGIATKPGEYTRFRITLPHEKKASDAAVA